MKLEARNLTKIYSGKKVVKDVSLNDIARKSQTLSNNDPLIKVAKGLGIYIGEFN